MCDADLVIVVSCVHQHGAPGELGPCGSIYPTLSDLRSIRRFFRQTGKNSQERRRRECLEVAWLLGARFTVQIVPAAGDEILHIVAGDIDVSSRESTRLAQAAWSFSVEHPADLVVTTIDGGPAQQTWHGLYRALEAASQVVAPGGSILVCSEIEHPLDRDALIGLLRYGPSVAADQRLPELAELQPATLITALHNVHIYLHSRLPHELVEDLGMVPVADFNEVVRICRSSRSPIVLGCGQHVWPQLMEETALVH
jgi:hypothetical protein